MNIILISTASVSTYLSDKLHAKYKEAGHKVTHILTENAKILWDIMYEYSTKRPAKINKIIVCNHEDECFRYYRENKGVFHIDVVNWADEIVVCPADFNFIGKIANGIADDIATSVMAAALGSNKPIYIAEAMNSMMYANKIHLDNVEKLKKMIPNIHFIEPTVKKLACGDYGIGGLADINAIFDITTGYRWQKPLRDIDLIGKHVYAGNGQYTIKAPKGNVNYVEYLPKFDEPGAFGAKRKFDRHEGVDIYCQRGSDVYAVEDGEVVASYQYTGKNANCDWWQDTWCIKVKGQSGVITYGELEMYDPSNSKFAYPLIGTKLKAGDWIGKVGQVLSDYKLRTDIRNHNVAMLHMELRTENCHLDGWKLDGDRDKKLLDPTPYLKMCV